MASPNILLSQIPPEGSPKLGGVTLESLQSLATAAALGQLNETAPIYYGTGAIADSAQLPTLEKQGGSDLPRREPDKTGGPIEKAGGGKGGGSGDNSGGDKKGGK